MKGFGIIIPGEKMGWIEKDIPEPGRYEALARPVAIAPCTSDVHLFRNPAMHGRRRVICETGRYCCSWRCHTGLENL